MALNLFIAGALIVVTYVWLGYSMNVLHNPLLTMLVYYPVLCLGGGTLLHRLHPEARDDREVILHPNPVTPTLLYSLLATAILWAGSLLIRPGWVEPDLISHGLEVCGMHREDYWLTAWAVMTVNPVFEEYLWRLGFFSFLYRRFSRNTAIHVSSLVFAGYHPVVVAQFFPITWLILVFLLVYLGGVAFASIFLRTRNIVYPIIIHMVVNLNLMLMGYIYAPSSG